MSKKDYKRPSIVLPYLDGFETGDSISIIRKEMKSLYTKYMQSKEWHELGKRIRLKQKNICFDCHCETKSNDGSVIHHLNYFYFGQGNYEEQSDCILLCKKCHNVRHKKIETKRITPFWAKQNTTAVFSSVTYRDRVQKQIDTIYMNL